MKVILTQHIASVGEPGDILDVPNGYARNYLFPNKLGVVATKQEIERSQSLVAKREQNTKNKEIAYEEIVKQLGDKVVEIKAEQVTEAGKLFSAISTDQISQGIQSQLKQSITSDMIDVEKPIKSVGAHTATVNFGDNKQISIKINIEKG
ncbi:50S ribosomal protein L9 [Patescibacteria group bacterium]